MVSRMARCIFCKSTSNPFRTREHILPESLGGGDWAMLPPDLFCDECQNVFGSSIEQQALNDYPFNLLRTFLGIPTKKGKAPWFASWEGKICSALRPGFFHIDTVSPFKEMIEAGEKTVIRIPAMPRRPGMVCRTLLKMAIEVIAADSPVDALGEAFDEARQYALTGSKLTKWWYLQREDRKLADDLFVRKEWESFDPFVLECFKADDEDDSAEIFHLKLFYLDFFVPMERRVIPQFEEFYEPEYRIFWT